MNREAAHWQRVLESRDICCSLVKTMEEAARDGIDGDRCIIAQGQTMPALPLPLADVVRTSEYAREVPVLGEANALLDSNP